MYSKDGYKRNSKDKKRPYNIIPSGDITMKGVDFPVRGTDNLGYSQTMLPGFDYTFPGTEVFEVPIRQQGGQNWLQKGANTLWNFSLPGVAHNVGKGAVDYFKNTTGDQRMEHLSNAGDTLYSMSTPGFIEESYGYAKDLYDGKSFYDVKEEALDSTQKKLQVFGNVPGPGDFGDGINAGIDFVRGATTDDQAKRDKHYKSGAVNLESIVNPVAGASATMDMFTDGETDFTGSTSLASNAVDAVTPEDKYIQTAGPPEATPDSPIKSRDAAEYGGEGGRTTALRNFMYDKKRNKTFAQEGGATAPTEQVAQDDPRYNRDMDGDSLPSTIDIDDSREVPNQLMLLQAMKESSLDPKKVSKKGAKGLTQVMPDTLKDYIKNTGDKDIDLYDWKDSMKVQNWYMNNLYKRPWINKQNQTQDVRLAKTLAAYNWGPTKFNKFLNKVKNNVDIYDNKMKWLDHPDLPIETKDYIKTVLLRENEEFEGWIQDHNKNESKQAFIEAYGGIYKKGGSLLFPEWKRIKKHWKNYLSGKSVNRDMYNKMVAYGFIKKKKYRRPDKKNKSFKNISSKSILKALNLGKMKKGGSLPEQVKIYEDYVKGIFDGSDLEQKAKNTVDKINRFYYFDLKGKDIHTLDHIKSQLNS